jgi:hypothetical protein
LTWNNGAVNDKDYDGNTTAIIKTAPTLNGIINNDAASVAAGGVFSFDGADASASVGVTAAGYDISGADAWKYNAPAAQPTFANAKINPKAITVSPTAGQSKQYGTNDPTFTYTPSEALIASNNFTGVLSRDAGEGVGAYAFTIGTLSAGGNYTLTLAGSVTFAITKADGKSVNAPTNNTSLLSSNSITINAVTAPEGQTVEYSKGGDVWQDGTTFTGLLPNTAYSIVARSKANDNYEAGKPSAALSVTTLNPQPPAIITTTLTGGTVGTTYDVTLTATGDNPITWAVDSGELPDGLTLNTDGTITGTPAAAGIFTFTVRATNSVNSATKELTITIAKAQVAKPAVTAAGLVYDGSEKYAGIAENAAVYTVTGGKAADAGNYNVAVTLTDKANYEWEDGTTADLSLAWAIGKAAGSAVTPPQSYEESAKTKNSITVAAIAALANGQIIEYAISKTDPASGLNWQDGTTFENLDADTTYYIFARAKANGNYNEGATVKVLEIKTNAGGLSGGAVTGIILGSTAALGGGGFCVYWFIIRKRKKV